MTTQIPSSPAGDAEGLEDAALETTTADMVCTGRVMSAAEYIAGFLAAGQMKSAATPHMLIKDVFPDVDPVVVQEIFNRGCATGWMGRGLYASPVLRGAELESLQGQLTRAGYEAMGHTVQRSRRLVAPVVPSHPADGETAREH